MNAEERIAKARRFVASLDAMDRRFGFASPTEVGETEVLRTIQAALSSAMTTDDWDQVAEAYVMADDRLKRAKE